MEHQHKSKEDQPKAKLQDVLLPQGNGESDHSVDLANITEWIRGFYEEVLHLKGQHLLVPEAPYRPVLTAASSVLTRNAKIANPSVFKRAAAFTAAFAMKTPISRPFGDAYPKSLTSIANHQNAIVPVEMSFFMLQEATINGHGAVRSLSQPIMISNHQYCDLIHAVANIRETDCDNAFAFLALLYESLCYRTNPKVSDEVFNLDGMVVNTGAFT